MFFYHWHDEEYMSFAKYLRYRSALAVTCYIIIHCMEVSCKEDQILIACVPCSFSDPQV